MVDVTRARYRLTTIVWLVIASIGVVPAWSAAAMTHSPAAPSAHHASLDDDTAHPPCAGEAADSMLCGGELVCAQLCAALPVASLDAPVPVAAGRPERASPCLSTVRIRPPHLPPKA